MPVRYDASDREPIAIDESELRRRRDVDTAQRDPAFAAVADSPQQYPDWQPSSAQ